MVTGWTPELQQRLLFGRHALHAVRLEIVWNGVPVCWEAQLPDDMVRFGTGLESGPMPEVVIWNRRD
jgi:hypothetical protein